MEQKSDLTSPYELDKKHLISIADEIRKGVFEICIVAESGHLGGSSSSVELMVALYFGGILRYNLNNPFDANRDRVLVRGHLGPLRYKLFSLLGFINEEELQTYRSIGSRLQGHEDHRNFASKCSKSSYGIWGFIPLKNNWSWIYSRYVRKIV